MDYLTQVYQRLGLPLQNVHLLEQYRHAYRPRIKRLDELKNIDTEEARKERRAIIDQRELALDRQMGIPFHR